MAQKLNPEYRKMLDTPASLTDGSRKNAIESLQKQIDFHVAETNRLRYTQNLHVAVSRLPTELLAEVFLYIVESGLQDSDTHFATGTFTFLQVCRHWNEVAISFPRLWSWWVAGAVKAWPLFRSRSKDTPLSLICRSQLPVSARNILTDPAIPSRVRRLDFSGASEQLTQFLSVFDSSPSNVSSIHLKISPYDNHEPNEQLARFLSSPFPKLSHLDLENFLPIPSSPIFTTSRLTSLKLSLPLGKNNPFTLSQFSQILQQHPSIRELDLNRAAIPLPGPERTASTPFILPQLVSLRLDGRETAISGFLDLIGMSSPLHDVIVRFGSGTRVATVTALARIMKEILAAYYKCEGLNHPRKASRLTISYNSEKRYLVFHSRSHPTPTSNPKSNLKLQFHGIDELARDKMVKEMFPFFPLDDVREFAIEGLFFDVDGHRGMFQKLKDLSHLRLERQYIWPVLRALSFGNNGELQQSIPKLKSLTLSHLDVLFECEKQLLDLLKERRDRNIGLQKLIVRSCRVHKAEYESSLRQLVKKVKWDSMAVVGSDYEGTDDESDLDEFEDDYEFAGGFYGFYP